jgi:hypothetical protein
MLFMLSGFKIIVMMGKKAAIPTNSRIDRKKVLGKSL